MLQLRPTDLKPIDWGYELKGMKNGQHHPHYDELLSASGYFETCAVGEALWDMDKDPNDWAKLKSETTKLGVIFVYYIDQKQWAKARACRLEIRRAIRREMK